MDRQVKTAGVGQVPRARDDTTAKAAADAVKSRRCWRARREARSDQRVWFALVGEL